MPLIYGKINVWQVLYCIHCRFFLIHSKIYVTEKLSKISKFWNKGVFSFFFLPPPRTFLILEWDGGSVTYNSSSTFAQQHASTLQRTEKTWSSRMATCHIFWIWNTQLKYVWWCQVVWWGEKWVTRWRRILLTSACTLFTRRKSALSCGPLERQLMLQKKSGLKP